MSGAEGGIRLGVAPGALPLCQVHCTAVTLPGELQYRLPRQSVPVQ